MATTINPRDVQLQAASTRLVGVSLPSNVVVDPDNVDGLGLILDGIKRVWISATSQIFQIAKTGTISPSSITLTANIRNLTGTPTLTIVPGSGTMSVVPALTAGVFSFTESQLTSDTVTLRLSLTEGSTTYSDDLTFVKVREGADSISGWLTNESHTVAADSAGNVLNYTGASGRFEVRLGLLDVRTVSTFSVASGGNPDGLTVAITASGSNAGNYSVTGGFPANKETVTITFNATYGTTVVPKVLTLTKSKAGTNGSGSVTWVVDGATVNASTATKTRATVAWDSGVSSQQGYAGGCSVSFTAGQTNSALMVGLNTDPTTSSNYQSIDYAFYAKSDGILDIYESGTLIGSFLGYTTSTRLEIRQSGGFVKYYKDGVVLRSVVVSDSTVLYADSSFYNQGASVNNLVFGPVGAAGQNGTQGVRGSRNFYYALGGSTNTWSDVIATTTASVDGGPVLNDQVTEYNNSMDFSQTKFWNGSTWVNVDAVIDGNLLVRGTVGASKVVVNAAQGTNVWVDANYADGTAWQVANWGVLPTRAVITDGVAGGTSLRSPVGGGASARGAFRSPVTVGKKYRVSCKARKSSTANGTLWLRLDVGTTKVGAYGEVIIGVEDISTVNTSWQEYSAIWTATHPWASPVVLVNYVGTAGYMEAQDIRIEEMNAAGLVVQGGIVADQIDSRGLSIKDANGNVLFAAGTALDYSLVGGTKPPSNATNGATIGVNLSGQITGANASTYIANAAIGTAQIEELNASKIVAGTITTDKIQVGAATAASSAAATFTSFVQSSSSSWTRNDNALTFISTGAPVLFECTVYVEVGNSVTAGSSLLSTVDSIDVSVGLSVDGVFKRASLGAVKTIPRSGAPSGGRFARVTLPLLWRETYSAGSHTFTVDCIVVPLDVSGNPVASPGLWAVSGYFVAQENKV